MSIVTTSSGPAILTDQFDVVMPWDTDLIVQLIDSTPEEVTDLIEALEVKVQESLTVIAKIKSLQVLDEADRALLNLGHRSHASVENIYVAICHARDWEARNHG